MPLLFLNTLQLLNKVYDQVRKDIQQQFDVMGAQVDVLLFLANHPQHNTAQAIVEVRKLTKSHASLAIKQLVADGYLTRQVNPANRKEYHLSLTPKSQPLIEYGQARQREFIATVFAGFSPDDRERFFEALQQIQHNLQESDPA